jgi:hypothetical protein
MAIVITIAGRTVTDAIDFRSVRISQYQEQKGDTLEFRMRVAHAAGTVNPPVAGNEVIITDGSTKEFAGVIITVTRRQSANLTVIYEIQCMDYVYYLDRRHLNKVYASAPVATMMREMLDDLKASADAEGGDAHYDFFQSHKTKIPTAGTEAQSPTIKSQRVDRVRPSAIFDVIAESAGMQWKLNFDKEVELFDIESNPATMLPLVFHNRVLNIDTNLEDFGDLEESEDISGIGTRPIIRDALIKSTDTITESFTVVTGNEKKFPLQHRPFSELDIVSVTLEGATQDQKLDGIIRDFHNDTTADGDVFIYIGPANRNDSYIRFPTPDISATDVIVVTYNYAFTDDHENSDPSGKSEMASRTGGDGIHEFIFSEASEIQVADLETLDQISEIILARRRQVQRTGRFFSFTKGWEAGQTFILTWPSQGIEYQAYVISVNKTIVFPNDEAKLSTNMFQSEITFSNIPTGVRL